ncbi:MAG: glycosyltransferase 87 family protein [Solirubrobacteraceae bacterium]
MRAPRNDQRRLEAGVLAAVAFGAVVAMLWAWRWNVRLNDYGTEAAAPLTALLEGRILTFFQAAPAYGGSLMMRAPFALPGSLSGGGALLIYRLAALPCLAALAALGVWLARSARRHGSTLPAAVLCVLLCVANPIVYRALALGHPEEALGAALCVAAVLAALRGRAVVAGVLLGLAIANKEWAVLAAGPVLLAVPGGRWRAVVIAGAVTGAFELPLFLSSPSASVGTSRIVVSQTGGTFYPFQAFWFFGAPGHWVTAMGPTWHGFRISPTWLDGRAHALIAWSGVPLSILAAWRRMRREDGLALLALLLLVRCWLDPWDVVYYTLPAIVALVAWEMMVARRMPLAASAATALVWLVFQYLPNHVDENAQAVAFLIPSTLGLVALAAVVYRVPPLRTWRTSLRPLSRPSAAPS